MYKRQVLLLEGGRIVCRRLSALWRGAVLVIVLSIRAFHCKEGMGMPGKAGDNLAL